MFLEVVTFLIALEYHGPLTYMDDTQKLQILELVKSMKHDQWRFYGGARGGHGPPRNFSGPFIGPHFSKEDIMSFLDFLIFYRVKSLVSASDPLADGLAFPRG